MLAVVLVTFWKSRVNVVDQNLRLVFPEYSAERHKEIRFKSMKLAVLNVFLALHQRFLINEQSWMDNYMDDTRDDTLAEFRADYAYKKCINVVPHYGTFYNMTGFFNIFRMVTVIFYHIEWPLFARLIFQCQRFKNKIVGMNQLSFQTYVRDLRRGHLSDTSRVINDCPCMVMLCDQKTKKTNRIRFLNQMVPFHTTPVEIHKATKRAIWVWFVHYDFERKKFQHIFTPVQRVYDDTDSQVILQRLADVLSEQILANPEQYLWLHNRFNLVKIRS